MENPQAARKWSDLRGIAVVSLANGTKIGSVDNFYFDPATSQVYAFRVKAGLFSHKILHVSDIRGIGQDAITCANEEAIQSASEDSQLSSLPDGETLPTFRVMSASGTVVGSVGEVLLDTSNPSTVQITGVVLSGGLLQHLGIHSSTMIKAQDIHYGQHVLVIPDEVAQTLQ
ncbi:MAG TPA: PRC-barrel domain-containing protein [Ktedonobacteraceae bacterium]|nr:PRC-barrel domain-containing protein [Ktedonobacteraceae bacterium]